MEVTINLVTINLVKAQAMKAEIWGQLHTAEMF